MTSYTRMSLLQGLLLLSFLPMACRSAATDIRAPPAIQPPRQSELPDEFYKTDSTVALPCYATGTGTITYEWHKDGALLDPNQRNIKRGEHGNIEIMNAGSLDEGKYQCFASSRYGTSLSREFHLRRAFIQPFPADKHIIDKYVNSGEPFTLDRIQTKSQPMATFNWMIITDVNDDKPQKLQRNSRILQDINGNLYFTYVKKEDGHLLKVNVANSQLDLIQGGSYTRIIVEGDGLPNRAPSLLYPRLSRSKITVVEGKELNVQCIFGGSPPPTVTWETPSNNYDLQESNTRVHVESATRAVEGPYKCTARNDVAVSSATIEVDVQTPPKFAEDGKPSAQVRSEGDTVSFRCKISADTEPSAQITWLVNAKPVDKGNPGPRTEITENGELFTIINLKRDEDIKVVQCKASNIHATVYADAPLNVLARTLLVHRPTDQRLPANVTTVFFFCNATTDPSTAGDVTYTWTRDGKRISFYDDPRFKDEGQSLTIDLSGLAETDMRSYAGEYACNASNGYSHDYAVGSLSFMGKAIPVVQSAFPLWLILVIVAIILLLLIIVLICCICIQRNDGESYPVDVHERKHGHDPNEELRQTGFHDYQRSNEELLVKGGSRASLSTLNMGSEGGDSLAEYGDMDEKVGEDGSFIGAYTSERPRKKITLSQSEA